MHKPEIRKLIYYVNSIISCLNVDVAILQDKKVFSLPSLKLSYEEMDNHFKDKWLLVIFYLLINRII